MAALAAFAAWLGVSLLVLSDGRRGQALGMALATLGLAALLVPSAGPTGSAALAAGGAVAAGRRAVVGAPGWGILPAGSTPRLVLCVAGGLLALWVGVAVMTGDGGALRFAAMAAIGLAAARVLGTDEASVAQAAATVLAVAIATAAALAPHPPEAWIYAAAGVIAAAVAWMPNGTPRAA